jgi:hypothetical protein
MSELPVFQRSAAQLAEVLVKVEHWGKQFPDEHRIAVYAGFLDTQETSDSQQVGELKHYLVGEVRAPLGLARVLRTIADQLCPYTVRLVWAGVELEPVGLPPEARAVLKMLPRALAWIQKRMR